MTVTPDGLPSVEDVIRFKGEGLEKFGGADANRPDDEKCIDAAIKGALQAAFYEAQEGRIDPIHLASFLLYYIAQRHCFLDGNKRAAWLTMTDFLLRHGLHVGATQEEAADMVLEVANGVRSKEQIVEWLAGAGRLVPIPSEETIDY